jgi:glucose-1-phosphate adenylyltransferase
MTRRVVCAILGGGRGTRLFPLTKERCKPAVPVAGKYRLIDIPVSNCLNSGYGRIFVITQYNTASLHRHISRSYVFDALSERFVEILAAEQTLEGESWYQGTADAVRRNLRHLGLSQASHLLVLSGDHLYRMNYAQLVRHHDESGADLTVAAQPVPASQAPSLGVLRINAAGCVDSFHEKPREDAAVRDFALPEPAGADPTSGEPLTHLASMGIYVFKPSVLRDLLETDLEDFGKQVIPHAISRCRVAAYPFSGYWEDIGTISTFYRANLELTDPLPRFSLFDERWPIYTRPRYLPPAKIGASSVERSIVADGCCIDRATLRHSIIGLRSVLGAGCEVADSILMGHDYYADPESLTAEGGPPGLEEEPVHPRGTPTLGIGAGSCISGAIVDKNVHIGEGVIIRGDPGSGRDLDADLFNVRDGIVVIPRGAILPPGTEIVL